MFQSIAYNLCHALIVKRPKALTQEKETKKSSFILLIHFFDRDCYPSCCFCSSQFFFLNLKHA